MSLSTTIYSDWGWDEVFATAVLAVALMRKGYKVFLEFPSPSERRGLVISKAYSVGITHRDGAKLVNSLALDFISDKKLGLVLKYDSTGKSEVLMRLASMESLTDVALEYVSTLNENVVLPKQIVDDIKNINNQRIDRLSKVGKVMYKALKMNYNNKEFRYLMYRFAYNVVTTKSLKPSEELIRESSKYDEALRLADRMVREGHYINMNNIKILTVSSNFNNEFIRKNLSLLKYVAYDALIRICRNDGFGILIQETELGHTMRICMFSRNRSFVDIIKSIPPEVSQKLYIVLRGNHLIIKFRDPKESSLDSMLEIASRVVASLAAR